MAIACLVVLLNMDLSHNNDLKKKVEAKAFKF